jgi:hypothetical protein
MNFLCWSYTIVELSACKTRGHISTFQRYFDSLTQKASRLLFITTIIQVIDPWILDVACWDSIRGWKTIGSQAILLEQLIFRIHKMEVETPVSFTGQSTRCEKWGLINDLIYQVDMLLPKMSRRYVCARHIFRRTGSKKYAGSQTNRNACSYPIIK